MTSVLSDERPRSVPEPGIADRLEALRAAVRQARGRLPEAEVDEVGAGAERAQARIGLSAEHTVVAIAGATGSGKSSTFNALTGLDLSAVGVRRPTTSWATACIWGSGDASAVLDWLGIPPRHQTTRDSMLDADREGRELDGVVLLDLPDHDSTEVSHHVEVDRLVERADLMVWVLDPQKYADAAIHERYLRPLAAHAEVMVVALNHLDTVPEDRRDSVLGDVRRLLAADGLASVPVIGVSAREGWGIDALRGEIADRVAGRASARSRVATDVRGAAERLAAAAGLSSAEGARAPELDEPRVARLVDELSAAAGVPALVERVEDVHRRRVRRATVWPPAAWLAPRRDAVARAGLDPDSGLAVLSDRGDGRGGEDRPGAGLQRSRVEGAVRATTDEVAEGLPDVWRAAVHRAGRGEQQPGGAPVADLTTDLESAVGGVDVDPRRLPGWVAAVRVLQWLALLAALAGAAWWVASATGGVEEVSLGPVAASWGLLVAGLAVGILLAAVGWFLAAGVARRRAQRAEDDLRVAVDAAVRPAVVEPVRAELAAHGEMAAALARARR